MPWRGPSYKGEFPTLGYQISDWITDHCVIPDGDLQGDPFVCTDEMLRFLVWFYRVDMDAGRKFVASRGGQLVRPQKWGKGPFSAAYSLAEAAGPVLPDGFDAAGDPVGRPWSTPWIQITAVSEDQTDNVWRSLVPMVELGSLKADIPDTGVTRINLPGRGLIEPVTSAGRSRLGQRITAAVQDETHSWVERDGGYKLADNQRRNLAGTGGRFLETTNSWDPTERSVAQRTNENPIGVHVDYPIPPSGSVRNKRERRKVIKAVYGDSWWVNPERIDAEVEALLAQGDAAQAERFFLNRAHAGESIAFDAAKWAELSQPETIVDEGSLIVIGIDGARYDDAIAVVAMSVDSAHLWTIGIWERPDDADDDYEHPLTEVEDAVNEAFDRWQVWRAYIDPQYIEHMVDRWQGRYGDRVVLEWRTGRPRQINHAVRTFRADLTSGDFTHSGDDMLTRHIENARRYQMPGRDDAGRQNQSIAKVSPASKLKVDAAMAAVLAHEARGDAIAAGAQPEVAPETYAPFRIR